MNGITELHLLNCKRNTKLVSPKSLPECQRSGGITCEGMGLSGGSGV